MPSLNGQAPGSLTIGDEHSVVSLIADGEDEGLGILAKSGTTTIKGAKINLTTSGTTSRVVQLAGPGVLMLGDSESVINITATGVDDGTGVAAFTNGSINIFGSELNIAVNGDDAAGLLTQNNDDTKPTPDANAASITVKATNTKINSEVIGLASYSGSRMTVDSNLIVDAPTAIEARGNAEMSINPEQDKSVKLKGDIRFATPGSTQGSGEVLDANVVVNLTTADSSWEGNLRREFPTAIADTDKVVVSRGLVLKLSNGATWTPTEVQVVSDGDKRVTTLAVNTLSLDNGVINMQKGTQTVEAKTITGTGGTVYVATTQDKEGNIAPQRKISVGSVAEGVTFRVTDGNKTTDDLVDIPKGLEGLQGTIESSDSDKPFEGTVTTFYEQGVINGYAEETVVNGVSQGVKVADNTMLDAYGSVAALTAFQWRHDMNDLSKRMGELRTSPAGVGAWARMYGSEQEYGAQGITQKNTSIQVGSDVDAGLGWKVGAAFTYTDGRSDYAEGSADHHAYGLGVYGTWFSENGQFVDLMAKYSRLDTDFELEQMSGDYANNAFSISAEYGWHLPVASVGFVEPQVELTYGQVIGDAFVSSNGAKVVQDDFESLIARAGVRSGFYFPKDKGTIHVRASVLHDFKGEADATASLASNSAVSKSLSDDLGGTWYELGLGANFNLSDSTYAYVDLEKTFAGAVEEKWRWNIGVRHMF